MAFGAVASGRTAQSGTDTADTLFAAGINAPVGNAGTYVDRLGQANAQAARTFWQYYQKALAITISGSLTIAERAITFNETCNDQTLLVASGGVLTIGTQQTQNSILYNLDVRANLIFLKSGTSSFSESSSMIRTQSGGTLNLYGSQLHTAGVIGFDAGSTVNIRNARIEMFPASNGSKPSIRQSATGLSIDGLILRNGNFALLATPTLFQNYTAIHCLFAIQMSSLVTTNGTVACRGLECIGNDNDVRVQSSTTANGLQRLQIINPKTSFFTLKIVSDTNSAGIGITEGVFEYNYTAKTAAGVGIVGARLYTVDSNSGVRNSTNRNGAGDYTADITNNLVAGVGGVFSTLSVVGGVYVKTTNPSNTSVMVLDDRRPISLAIASYGYLEYEEVLRPAATTGVAESKDAALAIDSFITQATAATVAGYTTRASVSLNDLYDYSAYDKTLATGIAEPSVFRRVIESGDGLAALNRYNLTINSSAGGIAINHSTDLLTVKNLSNGTFGELVQSAATTVDIVQTGTQSANVTIPATGIVTVPDGSTNLVAWSFTSGARINLRAGATAAAVTVGVGQDLKITAGAGVTVAAVRPTTVVQGFPTTANIHGVEPNPVLYVYDASNWALLAAFDSLDPQYSAGSFSIIPGDYSALLAAGNSIMVVGDAVGWRRTTATAIAISDPQTIIDLTFEEYVNEKGQAFMGTASAATGLSYDNANNRIELASASGGTGPGYKFAEVGYQFDLLTSTKAGGAFDLNLIRQITYISNDTYKRILIPGELKVAANATAATGPILEDFTLISLDGTDPRVHGLPSSVVGLIERPGVVINYQAPPTTVVLEGGTQVELADATLRELTSKIKGYVETGARRVLGEVER